MPNRTAFRDTIGRGLKSLSLPFAGAGGGRGGSSGLFDGKLGWNGNLPGAQYDYRREAGNLWDNSIVLALIKWQCRTWPEAKQVVFRPGADGKPEEVSQHPLLDLLENPSEDYDRSVLEAGLLLSWNVSGNAYAYKIRSATGKVVGLQYLPHFAVSPYWPKNGSEFLSGYVYRVNGQTYLLDKDDVVHLRDGIDPENARLGLSSLGACLREICTENEAATFAASLLRNMGIPGIIIAPKQIAQGVPPLTPVQQEEFIAKFVHKFRGEGRGEPWLQNIPVEVTTPGFSPEQLVLDKVRSIPVSRICAAVGIDPIVIGLSSEQKTYSNYKEAREAAYESCIIPTQRIFDMQLTRALMRDMLNVQPRDTLGRNYSSVRVLQEDQDALFERVANVYQKGLIKRKTGLRMIGETFDETKDDVYYTDLKAPMNATPGDEPQLDTDGKSVQAWIGKRWAQQREHCAEQERKRK